MWRSVVTGHKFTLVVGMKKLAPGKSSTEKSGDVASTVWLNDDPSNGEARARGEDT